MSACPCAVKKGGEDHEQRTRKNLRSERHRGQIIPEMAGQEVFSRRGGQDENSFHHRDPAAKHHWAAPHGTCP